MLEVIIILLKVVWEIVLLILVGSLVLVTVLLVTESFLIIKTKKNQRQRERSMNQPRS